MTDPLLLCARGNRAPTGSHRDARFLGAAPSPGRGGRSAVGSRRPLPLAAWALLDVRYYEAPVWSVVVGAAGGAVGTWWALRQLPDVWGS
jgi:hypothetical protein